MAHSRKIIENCRKKNQDLYEKLDFLRLHDFYVDSEYFQRWTPFNQTSNDAKDLLRLRTHGQTHNERLQRICQLKLNEFGYLEEQEYFNWAYPSAVHLMLYKLGKGLQDSWQRRHETIAAIMRWQASNLLAPHPLCEVERIASEWCLRHHEGDFCNWEFYDGGFAVWERELGIADPSQ